MRVDPGGLVPGWGPPLLRCCGVCSGVPSACGPPGGGGPLRGCCSGAPPGGAVFVGPSSLPRVGLCPPGAGIVVVSMAPGPAWGVAALPGSCRGDRFPFGLGLLNRAVDASGPVAGEAWWAGWGPSPLGVPPLGLGLPNRTVDACGPVAGGACWTRGGLAGFGGGFHVAPSATPRARGPVGLRLAPG